MIWCIINLVILGGILYAFLRLNCNPLLAIYAHFFAEKSAEKLKNKVIWVIGASSGIGEELAYQLADLNCRLILTSTSENKLKEVKQRCLERSANKLKSDDVLVLAYDITDFSKNDEAFAEILQKFGNIDILITNAARILTGRILEENLDQTKQLFDVNYFAPVHITRIVLKHWLDTKSKGQILATSSVASYVDFPFFSTYTATKRALNAFYRDVAQQHQCDGITVSLVMPGPTATELIKKSIRVKGRLASFGKNHAAMSTKLTCEYIIIAMANKLNESWISIQPMLLFTYISDLFHYQIHFFARLINFPRIFEKNILK